MTARIRVALTVNGVAHEVMVEPRRMLCDVLREELGLTGTHIGCQHGVCGACTVIVNAAPVRSCLMLAAQADGAAVRTVEGLADGDRLHPLQAAFITHHGLQCGFCTPGFLMLATAALEADPDLDDMALRDLVSSNLCRCTGYAGILRAVRAAADAMRKERGDGPLGGT